MSVLAAVTWNVHRCIGLDGIRDVGRVAAVLRELDADVVALQEVESGGPNGGPLRQLAELAQATGLTGVAGPTLREDRGDYGNALLTRFPVRASREIDLSVPGREPRGAIVTDLAAGSVSLRVVTTHLGLRASERRFQAGRLLAELSGSARTALILCGDWNEWLPRSRVLGWFRSRFGPAPAPRTFPTGRPLFALDRVWAAPPSTVERVEAHRAGLACVASDHLPVRATVRLRVG